MGVLYLIGLGLWDENDMTRRAVSLAASCGNVFMEEYTSRLVGADPEAISKAIGHPVTVIGRSAVEDGGIILEAARDGEAALLCGGDPAFATTHSELAIRAREVGTEVRWIHAPSIFSAASALSGLSPYKFGRTTTLIMPRGDYLPTSPLEVMARNREMGLHTLILLDLDREQEPPRYMLIPDALDVIEKLEEKTGLGVIKDDVCLTGIARAGSIDPVVRCGPMATLREVEWGGPLHTLLLPGELHFMEARGLVVLARADERILKE